MGLFSKKSTDEKGRQAATKRGIDVSEARFVAHGGAPDAPATLVLADEWVELHEHGQRGSITGKGKSVRRLKRTALESVSVERQGIHAFVIMGGAGTELRYQTDVIQAEEVAREVRGIM